MIEHEEQPQLGKTYSVFHAALLDDMSLRWRITRPRYDVWRVEHFEQGNITRVDAFGSEHQAFEEVAYTPPKEKDMAKKKQPNRLERSQLMRELAEKMLPTGASNMEVFKVAQEKYGETPSTNMMAELRRKLGISGGQRAKKSTKKAVAKTAPATKRKPSKLKAIITELVIAMRVEGITFVQVHDDGTVKAQKVERLEFQL